MFKNMLKRSWLSVARKPSRTIILTAILFVMANMILATLAIKTSVERSVDYAKESLSGIVYLQPDMEAIRGEMAPPDPSSSAAPTLVEITRPTIYVDTVESIGDSDYIKDYTYSVQTSADANGFTPVETEEQSMREQINSFRDGNTGGGPMPGGGALMISGFARGDMTLMGINSFAFISEVESGNMTLASGKIFDESTDDSVVISQDLASANNLSVGDTIQLDTVVDDDSDEEPTTIPLTIIGIYDTTSDNFNTNTIYLNPATAAKFLSAEDYNNGNFGVSDVKYYLTNAEYKDAFVAEADEKYPNLAADNLKLDIDDSAYQQMVGPIESVGSFATTILWVVIVAAVAIITLIVTINVKDRRYEMGVLLSLGASKLNILGQFILELVIVGTIGFALSITTSTFIAKAMGSSLLESQLSMNEQQSAQNFGRGQNATGPSFSTSSGTRGGGPMNNIGVSQSNIDAIDEIDVSPAPSDYALLFVAGYLILIISLAIPSINVLRYQPKTILTGKE